MSVTVLSYVKLAVYCRSIGWNVTFRPGAVEISIPTAFGPMPEHVLLRDFTPLFVLRRVLDCEPAEARKAADAFLHHVIQGQST